MNLSVSKAASIQFVIHDARDGNRNYYGSALPPMCIPSIYLPYVTARDQMSPIHIHIL